MAQWMASNLSLFGIRSIFLDRNIFHNIQTFIIQIKIPYWLWVYVRGNSWYCSITPYYCLLFDFILQIWRSKQIYGWTQLYGNISNVILLHIRLRRKLTFRIRCIFRISISSCTCPRCKYCFNSIRNRKSYYILY